MSLAQFEIIVAIDQGNGIAKEGNIPWNHPSDMRFFRDTTMGRGKNAIIMGRKTYETIPIDYRPLRNRKCFIVSRTWKQEEHPEIGVCSSLVEALSAIGGSIKSYDSVFIIGGEQVYNEAIRDFMYLCKRIIVTKFKKNYDCDQFFPWDAVKEYPADRDTQKTRDYARHFFSPADIHGENTYLDLLRTILEEGESKPDRTGTGTKSIFGVQMRFNISERLPIVTTKKIFYENILKELLFFVSGKTNTKILEEQGVNIWKGNTSQDFIDKRGLEYDEGDMGAMYGHQWRHWNAKYDGADADYSDQGIDQLSDLITNIRDNPHSRRHILTTWNPEQLDEMVIHPCHFAVQFNVSGNRKYLDCQLYQRSADMFLGVPYNITSYCILTYMIAHLTGLKPRYFIHSIGDAHIYSNHETQVNKQLSRTPRPFPIMKLRRGHKIHEIDDFDFENFVIEGYTSWPFISAKMAI